MGNNPSRTSSSQGAASGGSASSASISGPDGGYLIPMTGTYPVVAQEWDKAVVTRLIMNRQLAPFYRGLQDEFELPDEAESSGLFLDDETTRDEAAIAEQETQREAKIMELDSLLNEVGIKPGQESVGEQGLVGQRAKETHARIRAEMEAYARGTLECPICML